MKDSIEKRMKELSDPEIMEKRWRDEIDNFLRETEKWSVSPPSEIHAEFLIADALTEPRPVDEQLLRLRIAFSYLLSMIPKEITNNNIKLIDLFLTGLTGKDEAKS